MMKRAKKAIIDLASLESNFLPLSKEVSRELLPVGDMPIVYHLVEEAVEIGAESVVFLSEGGEDSSLASFFTALEEEAEELKKKGNPRFKRVEKAAEQFSELKFSFTDDLQDAISGSESFSYLSSEHLFLGDKKGLAQLMDVFKTSERPVIAILNEENEAIETEKIARSLFKIKRLDEDLDFSELGRAIFTSESKKFFKKKKKVEEALKEMIYRGHTVYGTKIKGDFLEVEDYQSLLKANILYGLKLKSLTELEDILKEGNL